MDDTLFIDGKYTNLNKIKESLSLAETLAKVNLLTSPSARKRLVAKSLELKFRWMDEVSGNFEPPRQLLLYLVRMGSFSSSPKILNDDNQDDDVIFPENINRVELLDFCQKQFKNYSRLKRSFKTNVDSSEANILTRKGSCLSSSDSLNLRILTWNILSQALGQMNDNFACCPDEALDWNFRRYRIIYEILEHNPDVICLQEVDHFNFLKNVLETQDYTGLFFPKPDSPCIYINGNNGPDGCALFYKKNKFHLIKAETHVLEIWKVESNQVAILVILGMKDTGQEICITTTHLKAKSGALLSTFRNEQGKDLINFVSEHCEDRPVVLCGDFNAEPSEPIYSTITSEHYLNLSSAYADCGTNMKLSSVDREPLYTTWKIRDEGEICHTIDYIFYSKNNLKVESILKFPTGDEIGEKRIPSYLYPSDHFSLVCDLKIKSNMNVHL